MDIILQVQKNAGSQVSPGATQHHSVKTPWGYWSREPRAESGSGLGQGTCRKHLEYPVPLKGERSPWDEEAGPRNPVWLMVIVWLWRSWRCALTKQSARHTRSAAQARAQRSKCAGAG